jgi:hypothetical protein
MGEAITITEIAKTDRKANAAQDFFKDCTTCCSYRFVLALPYISHIVLIYLSSEMLRTAIE